MLPDWAISDNGVWVQVAAFPP